MREYLITLLISAALCYLITPLVRTQAIRFGAVAAIRDREAGDTIDITLVREGNSIEVTVELIERPDN